MELLSHEQREAKKRAKGEDAFDAIWSDDAGEWD